MSRVKVKTKVVHTPSFKEWKISATGMKQKIEALGLALPMNLLDGYYYYTNAEGWAEILFHLIVKSSLYIPERFDCDSYALKAMTLCAELYGLNTLAFVIGDIPEGRHAFNMLYTGSDFLLWEPNEGFGLAGQAFPIGENGYKPEWVLI